IAIVSAGIADGESLAHELGHTFTLDHVNHSGAFDDPHFSAANIMYSGGYSRTSFSYGQVFRMNVNQPSSINVFHKRPGPTRSCPDSPTAAPSMSCPSRWLTVP
ncbi:MAG TPA: hypothetical protein VN628_10140, partial [Vicinamibacterales bacterium]|nr:hypothetical protein [Vicinamibacterales bacterium]